MIKKNLIFITFILLFLSNSVYPDPNSGPKPIAIVIELDAWAACTEMPTMALYEDGTFIFSDMSLNERCKYKYKQKKLTDNEITQLGKKIGPTKEFISLEEDMFLVPAFDCPEVKIFLSNKQYSKAVSIDGIYVKEKKLAMCDGGDPENNIPKEFNRVFELLQSISREGASEYKPEYVRVNLELLEDQSIKAISWPKYWPDLNDKNTIKWGNSNYSIYLPASKKVEKYFSKLAKKNGAILLDGKKWDGYKSRISFPNEHVWGKIFKSIPEF